MNAPVLVTSIDPLLSFLHRAAARLVLVEAGEMDLDAAVADLMPPCACASETVAMWERKYPPRRQWQRASRRPTPQATIEAIMFCVSQRGVQALKEPASVERLSRCDERACAEINRRIKKIGGDNAQES